MADYCFFFFQAEDGIRDLTVTGVQTCALPIFGPAPTNGDVGRVEKQRHEVDAVEVAALERLVAFAQLLAHSGGGRLREFPEPGLLAQRLHVAHRQATHERADHQRLQRLGPHQLGTPREQLGGERLGSLPDLRDLQLELSLLGLQLAGAKPVAQPAPVVAQPALVVGPALVTGAPQPGVELVLNGTLDDQPGAQLRELRQRLPRILTDSHGKQPIDLLLNHDITGVDLDSRLDGRFLMPWEHDKPARMGSHACVLPDREVQYPTAIHADALAYEGVGRLSVAWTLILDPFVYAPCQGLVLRHTALASIIHSGQSFHSSGERTIGTDR